MSSAGAILLELTFFYTLEAGGRNPAFKKWSVETFYDTMNDLIFEHRIETFFLRAENMW